MLRALAELDEVKLFGSTWVAYIDRSATELAARVGLAVTRDPDFLPGLGPFDFFSAETDTGLLFSVASPIGRPRPATVFAHAIAHVPAIAEALGVPLDEIERETSDPPRPWHVVRLDDNGNRFTLNRCMDAHTAHRAARLWARRIGDHHQTILVVEDR